MLSSYNIVVLQRDVDVIFNFEVKALTSCNSIIAFPAYNGALDLSQGQLSTPAISPTKDFYFNCGMSMLFGYVKVVDDIDDINIDAIKAEAIELLPESTGGSCCD